ncbi:MAG: hypothetical protein HZB92_08340 [Euryarchaeota archaeon]|nr:hypothetical protein [Euryarchaeota archaeon]
MDIDQARQLVEYAATKTRPRWEQYAVSWNAIDEVFIVRGYEQGGFESWKFAELLKAHGIFSISKLGTILSGYRGNPKYLRKFAGGMASPFYEGLKSGTYGDEGQRFHECVAGYRGKAGAWFWSKLWQMLVCCHHLKGNYAGSFAHFLKSKYAAFTDVEAVSDGQLLSCLSDEWQRFKKASKPWNELYGIGENVFDYVLGDVKEAAFVKDSYKLDSANIHFLRVTGIAGLIGELDYDVVVNFLKALELPYSIREINKGLYTYCSVSEAINFGFCRDLQKCDGCEVNRLCEKNIG